MVLSVYEPQYSLLPQESWTTVSSLVLAIRIDWLGLLGGCKSKIDFEDIDSWIQGNYFICPLSYWTNLSIAMPPGPLPNVTAPKCEFYFVNKSARSSNLSRSEAGKKSEIFRHVQRWRKRPRPHTAPADAALKRDHVQSKAFLQAPALEQLGRQRIDEAGDCIAVSPYPKQATSGIPAAGAPTLRFQYSVSVQHLLLRLPISSLIPCGCTGSSAVNAETVLPPLQRRDQPPPLGLDSATIKLSFENYMRLMHPHNPILRGARFPRERFANWKLIDRSILLFGAALGQTYSHNDPLNSNSIPGWPYFASAAPVLDEFPKEADLSHLQANLLAALYMGQLAQPSQAYRYLSNACRICQILICAGRANSENITPASKNPIKLAFWSCLQLEHDFITELHLPRSHIWEYDKGWTQIPEPEYWASCTDLKRYTDQIFLRRMLDKIHRTLNIDVPGLKPDFRLIDNLDECLEAWRKHLGDKNWDDNDYCCAEVSDARRRARYYETKYTIHRSALLFLLDSLHLRPPYTPNLSCDSIYASPPVSVTSSSSEFIDHNVETEILLISGEQDGKRLLRSARACIHAAVRNIMIFDPMPSSLVANNAFFVAQA